MVAVAVGERDGVKSHELIDGSGLIGVALLPSSAFAWDVGHRVVCQIAYEELKPEIKARVDAPRHAACGGVRMRMFTKVATVFMKAVTAEQSCKALSLRLSGTPPRGAVYPTGV